MRSLSPAPALLALCALGCSHAPPPRREGPLIELRLDEGRAQERPLTPSRLFELLILFEPRMTSYQPVELRFLLAQPGHLVFHVYAVTGEGLPGPALKTIDRIYGPDLVSDSGDGKWVVEPLGDLPLQGGQLFIGLHGPDRQSDPRLWATSNDTGRVVQRDNDPRAPISRSRRTPILRLVVAPRP